jgi:NAD(P)-dependent dehydrogenase (short-subunit alcohol dehydrogenase family)
VLSQFYTMTFMTSFNAAANVAIVGASGGIGQAAVQLLSDDPSVGLVHAFSRDATNTRDGKVHRLPIALLDEQSIISAVEFAASRAPLDLVFVASGMLHRDSAVQPEKTIQALSMTAMSEVFSVNTIGPALLAKHFLPAMRKTGKTVFVALSARVGSISDNRLGGWVSYRASKAALNMVVKTIAVEQARHRPESIVVSLHPGTVDTALSKPFSAGVSENSLFTPEHSAACLLKVIDGLNVTDSGGFFAWDGAAIEY